MNHRPNAPSMIGDVRHLATALYQDRFEVITDRAEIDSYSNGQGGTNSNYAKPRTWAEIGGITNQRAAAILKDFLEEFNTVIVERDRLKSTLRQIAEMAIKEGDL